MSTSPTQRTLKLFRELGFTCAVTERWNAYAKIRQDLFGFQDLVALGTHIIGIQTTSTANLSARKKKIDDSPEAEIWQNAGGVILVVGWSKKGARGKAKHWEPTIHARLSSLGWHPLSEEKVKSEWAPSAKPS